MKHEITHLLFNTEAVVNLDTKKYIEVQPGIMSPMIINIKAILRNVKVRQRLAKELAKRVNPKSIGICGIESGGNYFAAAVADILQKPLVFFRKESKTYGIGNRFVGFLPEKKGELITMIDDVLAGGMISTANNKFLSERGYISELLVIYSYLPKMVGPMATVKVKTLADINSLCEIGLKIGRFTNSDVKIIKKDCVYSNI
ncbi:hypothetical protein KKC00_02850 [Patescibacteria group bacterium]|nr:hypothetical protein [Patescibacteria group bacterium]